MMKNDKKCFLFHIKVSVRSSDIYFFLSSVAMQENSSIRKLILISKFLKSQIEKQLQYTYYPIFKEVSKGNQTIYIDR